MTATGIFHAATTAADVVRVDARFVLEDTFELPAPSRDRAVLIVVREQFVRQNPMPYECVFLDGDPVQLLPQRSWFALEVAPGDHCISGIVECPPTWVHCEAGQSCLLRLRELIDAIDRRTCNLLLDEPSILPRLVERHGLARVTPTSGGRNYLARRRGAARSCEAPLPNAPAATAVEFEPVRCEQPLAPVNVERDFTLLSGRITVDSTGLHYRLSGRIATSLFTWRTVSESLDIRHEQVVAVRLGGTRFTSVIPWVNVVYRGDEGLRTASFADFREAEGAATYNRLFEALRDCAFRAHAADSSLQAASGGR